jgi:Fe-S cluster assembly iron-binding protein IscA
MIQITDSARDKIKELTETKDEKHLRVYIAGIG